ncbi:hypothetical protein GCM10028791_19130 [Echinicola sediminis]
MRKAQILLILIFLSFNLQAQDYATDDRKAIRLYQEGEELVLRRRYEEAISKFEASVKRDEDFLQAYKKWAQLLQDKGDMEGALEVASWGDQRSSENNELKAEFSWLIINVLLKSGRFPEAVEKFKTSHHYFSSQLKASPSYRRMYQQLRFIEQEIADAKSIEKEKLDVPLNGFRLQYFPVLTADSKHILFTKRDGVGRVEHEDIFSSYWDGQSWTVPETLGEAINTDHNEGTCTISADGSILIFTSCDALDSFGSCDLYIAYKIDGEWQKPINMGDKVNSRYWDSQPSLSADGSILFFSSNRRGGYGGNDIYYSTRMDNGTWSDPKNVGETINTKYDEVSPFIYFNNEQLFFASDGHLGFGGMDLYSSKIVKGSFEEPSNLGYPINDHRDQLALFITAQRDYAYYTENSLNGGILERSFLYRFAFPEEIDLGERLVVTGGRVMNEKTGEPISATLSLVNLKNDSTMYEFKSHGDSGKFMMIYPDKAFSGLYVEKKGFLPKIYNVEKDSLKNIKGMDIGLKPLASGEQFLFENVFFDFDKAELKPESKSSLLRLKRFLEENAKINIIIEGHTDNIGEEEYNQQLSMRRAESVREYLVDNGIQKSRLSISGWGDKRPVVPNTSQVNRSKNRRIEIVIE